MSTLLCSMKGSRFFETVSTHWIEVGLPKIAVDTCLATSTSKPSGLPEAVLQPNRGWSILVPTISLPRFWMASMVEPAGILGRTPPPGTSCPHPAVASARMAARLTSRALLDFMRIRPPQRGRQASRARPRKSIAATAALTPRKLPLGEMARFVLPAFPWHHGTNHRSSHRGAGSREGPGTAPKVSAQRRRLAAGEPQPPTHRVDQHRVAVADLAGQQAPGQLVADRLVDQAAQRPRPVHRVEAAVGQPGTRGLGQLQAEAPLRQAGAEARDLQVDNRCQVVTRQAVEHQDLVEAVAELGLEGLA